MAPWPACCMLLCISALSPPPHIATLVRAHVATLHTADILGNIFTGKIFLRGAMTIEIHCRQLLKHGAGQRRLGEAGRGGGEAMLMTQDLVGGGLPGHQTRAGGCWRTLSLTPHCSTPASPQPHNPLLRPQIAETSRAQDKRQSYRYHTVPPPSLCGR